MKQLVIFCALMAVANAALAAGEKVRVSSFSTILTEIAERVGGERVEVTGHVQAGIDPHEFEPKPADLQTVSASQLVLLSAKHMEGYVDKLQQATGGRGNFLEVGNGFASLKSSGDGHQHSDEDPHWWHSVANVRRATRLVRDALVKVSPTDKALFSAQAAAYLAELEALEKWVKNKLSELPRNQRKLVTSHDAFQYFAKENGFTIYPIEGVSTGDQPSSKRVADLVGVIKKEGVKAIFSEQIENPKVLQEITRETGAKLGGELLADGLGEGAESTFAGMMKHNVTVIVDALK